MKFEFQPATAEEFADIKYYLYKTYAGAESVYYCDIQPLASCCVQFFELSKSLCSALKTIDHIDTKPLEDRIDLLHRNIAKHVDNIEDYSTAEQKNTQAMCNYGKKRFEQICYIFVTAKHKSQKMIDVLTAFLYSEQIETCMGGLLTIIEDSYYALAFDVQTLIQHVCLTKIKFDALTFISNFDLLRLYNEGNIETTRMRHAAIHTETHFVNVLYNRVARDLGWLQPLDDAYDRLYISHQYWIDRFAYQCSNEFLVDYFIQWYINDLPTCLPYFNHEVYNIICQKLDLLGPDESFTLYDDNVYAIPLKDNHQLILRASIIKRMISSNLLRLELDELKCSTQIRQIKYHLYLLSEKNNCWIEWSNQQQGESGMLPLSNALPRLFHEAIFTMLGTPTCLHKKLLFAAVVNDNTSLLHDLLALKISPNIINNIKHTPLMTSTMYNCTATAAALLQIPKLRLNQVDQQNSTALILAAKHGRTAIANLILLRPDVKANMQDKLGFTALMYAAEAENIEIMRELLLQKDCGLNLQNAAGYTALMLAVNANKIKAVMLLLGCIQVDVNCQTLKGNSALIIAAAFGYDPIVTQLLANPGIRINHKNLHGTTALIYAVKRMNSETLRLLLESPSINLKTKNNRGENALSLAKFSDCKEMVAWLESKLSKSQQSICTCTVV